MKHVTQPFARALTLVQAMHEIVKLKLSALETQQLISQLPSYRSRGKGKDKPFIRSVLSLRMGTSKYMPHQGKRECARRAKQYHSLIEHIPTSPRSNTWQDPKLTHLSVAYARGMEDAAKRNGVPL